jgi:tripartite-type tricarboxylate transporter receptor subunit TctC
VLQSDELKRQFDSQSAVPSPTTPDEFAAFVREEQAKWARVVRATGVKFD